MKIIEVLELNENGVSVDDVNLGTPAEVRYFDDNCGLPDGNFDENNIAGNWVHLEGKHEIGTFAYRQIDDSTLVNIDDNWEYAEERNELESSFDDLELEIETNTPGLKRKLVEINSIGVTINSDGKIEEVAAGYYNNHNIVEVFLGHDQLEKADQTLGLIAKMQWD